ncbi:D-Ala-D-Ala carboxypeptidase family metallohydrolase [Xylanibacter ruminicola]|uniref:Peptidase M15 n=1 Tax=Xylanibacter ruminicola TaxID=839 RepID=A0A1M6V5X5_XYLRU|nr:D-Ala-D-Ala carboxypeptidase family metallohydrolase [Xylanibacter ruminicola]SHK76761.1 Peptidase M15 [Xylanibacter ruminicola]
MEQIIQLNSQAKLSEHLASPSEAALGHSNKLDGSHLSPNFTLGELTRSASHPEVYNIPSHEAIANLKRVCVWLEELRKRYNQPIIINSGYRSPQLNRAIGGVATSNHLTGCAVDICVSGLEQLIVYAAILLDISRDWQQDFDELLIEKNRYGAVWLHFAVRAKDNRRKILFINA